MRFSRLGSCTILSTALMVGAAARLCAEPWAGDKIVTLGIDARWLPLWEGSSRYVALPLPLFDIRPAGTPQRFRAPRDGFGFGLADNGRFRVGPVAKLRVPRREEDDPRLAGLGNVGWAVEVGGFADLWWHPWLRSRTELRQGFGGHRGFVADLTTDVVLPVTTDLTFSAGPRLTVASAAATSPYFSISAAQSLTSGLPAYDAGGGVRSFGAGTQLRYAFRPRWSSYVFMEYERLSGDASHSPLVVQRGTPNQWSFGGGVSYSFDMRF